MSNDFPSDNIVEFFLSGKAILVEKSSCDLILGWYYCIRINRKTLSKESAISRS